jgi:hypothetical protein
MAFFEANSQQLYSKMFELAYYFFLKERASFLFSKTDH